MRKPTSRQVAAAATVRARLGTLTLESAVDIAAEELGENGTNVMRAFELVYPVRKRTKFETCARHAATLEALPRRRRAEFYVEGGPAGSAGCSGGVCRLWPGTDLFVPDVCHGEMELEWTTAGGRGL